CDDVQNLISGWGGGCRPLGLAAKAAGKIAAGRSRVAASGLNGSPGRPILAASQPSDSRKGPPRMQCHACDADNPSTAKFCNACGARLGLACSNCGHINGAGSRFCTECGGQLTAAPRSGAAVQRPGAGAPSQYTPPHLAEKILASRSAVGRARKQAYLL